MEISGIKRRQKLCIFQPKARIICTKSPAKNQTQLEPYIMAYIASNGLIYATNNKTN